MSYLLRVELPDVPGSLGLVASTIGAAGGNIEAIEMIEHRHDGQAIDDMFLELPSGVMPDSVISAITALNGVRVQWISRYNAGANITRDLEALEEMTSDSRRAADVLVELIPETFRVDWAMRLRRNGGGFAIMHRTGAAPDAIPDGIAWPEEFSGGTRFELPEPWQDIVCAGCPLGEDEEMLVVARRGGPAILDSEMARLCHLADLSVTISQK